jgi:hypothetical protein
MPHFNNSISPTIVTYSVSAVHTLVSYSASVVKVYSATNGQHNTYFSTLKMLKPTTTLALYVLVNLKVVGLAPRVNVSYNLFPRKITVRRFFLGIYSEKDFSILYSRKIYIFSKILGLKMYEKSPLGPKIGQPIF